MFIFSENIRPASKEKVESCTNELDTNLINRIRNGDLKSFEEIVNRYKDKALTLTMRILKNREDSEDALQDAFVKTYRAIMDKQFEERSKFSTYFYRIVYNTAIDYYKKNKTRDFNLISIDEKTNTYSDNEKAMDTFDMKIDKRHYQTGGAFVADKMTLDNQTQDIVNSFLDQIPRKYSAILTLFYVNNLSHEEISKSLGLPLGTVKNRIFRAKDKLKEVMLSNFNEDEIMELI